MTRSLPWIAAGAALTLLPFVYHAAYPLHILVLVLIWSFVYTSWSVMGVSAWFRSAMAGSWASAPTSRRFYGTITT